MMRIQQYVHQLNNSELGRTGVHETYVSIPRGVVPKLGFLSLGEKKISFKRNNRVYDIQFRNVNNGEFRITGLGRLYRESGVNAGDLIIIEDESGVLRVDFVYRENLLVFGALKKDGLFECRNEDRLLKIINKKVKCYKDGEIVELIIESKGNVQPRTDSLRRVNVYGIKIDGNLLIGGKNQVYNLFMMEEGNFFVRSTPDAIRKLEWGDHE
jgi:hypothetical protein